MTTKGPRLFQSKDGQRVAVREIDGRRYLYSISIPIPGSSFAVGLSDSIRAQDSGDFYALIGLRASPTGGDVDIDIGLISVIAESNNQFEWAIFENPTVAGPWTFGPVPDGQNSEAEVAFGNTVDNPSPNTVTGGTRRASGYGDKQETIASEVQAITPLDEISSLVLAVRGLTANGRFQGGVVWREVRNS